MPALMKEAVSKQLGSNCRRQLFYLLYPDNSEFAEQRAAYDIPRIQEPKPGLEQFREEGQRWQLEVTNDLAAVFGPGSVLCTRRPNGTIAPSPARALLTGVQPGRFLAEAEFQPGESFLRLFGLAGFRDSRGYPLVTSPFRPDLIAVHEARTFDYVVRASDGTAQAHEGDARKQLQVIDVKLSSEPSAGYYAETVLYSVALATWLEDTGLANEYCVCASPAIWPGSLGPTNLQQVRTEQPVPPPAAFLEALRRDLEITPYDAFFARVRQLLSQDLPQVLGVDDWRQLDVYCVSLNDRMARKN
ncbi:MAG: hypothetical protein JSR82_23760 [Verrucomicrobia bacterium]|nr:hypothetical protein [Verrucomicrobiota bacterium]